MSPCDIIIETPSLSLFLREEIFNCFFALSRRAFWCLGSNERELRSFESFTKFLNSVHIFVHSVKMNAVHAFVHDTWTAFRTIVLMNAVLHTSGYKPLLSFIYDRYTKLIKRHDPLWIGHKPVEFQFIFNELEFYCFLTTCLHWGNFVVTNQ